MGIKDKTRKLFMLFTNPDYRFSFLFHRGFYKSMPDDEIVKRLWKYRMHTDLDLNNPQTFNEKLQWLKLHDHKPEYHIMADKYRVRKYIADTIGEEYLIPLIGVWDSPDDIDFDSMPSQFVLKCNHNSGLGMCICKDKSMLDIKNVKRELRKGLAEDFYYHSREWPYKDIPRKIIAEKYMTDESGTELKDYKVLCFGGVPKLIELHTGRFTDTHYQDFYNADWEKLAMNQLGEMSSPNLAPKPSCLDEMLKLSAVLSKNIPHVRVDWYIVNGKLYFGELTFFDASGFDPFNDIKDDYLLGSWIDLAGVKS